MLLEKMPSMQDEQRYRSAGFVVCARFRRVMRLFLVPFKYLTPSDARSGGLASFAASGSTARAPTSRPTSSRSSSLARATGSI